MFRGIKYILVQNINENFDALHFVVSNYDTEAY